MLKLLMLFAASINQTDLTIYYNPTDSYGQAVKHQLTTDYIAVADTWSGKERIIARQAIIEHEFNRRRIHKYFRIKFVESSDRLSFSIGPGNRIRVPTAKTADPREMPGYIDFFSYLVDVHYRDYFDDIRKDRNHDVWLAWYRDRNTKHTIFVFDMIDKGFTSYDDGAFVFDMLDTFRKDGKFFTAESLGWKEPEPPKLIPTLPNKICPLDPEWELPK